MSSAALALQAAVVAALLDDAAVVALVDARVYDAPPRNAAFPYVALGPAGVTDWSTSTEAGAEHALAITVWSRERGKRACHEILAAVEAALHDADLTLSGHALVNLRFERSETRRETDGITWRGTAHFRAVTEAV
jgi:hypothetical protein